MRPLRVVVDPNVLISLLTWKRLPLRWRIDHFTTRVVS